MLYLYHYLSSLRDFGIPEGWKRTEIAALELHGSSLGSRLRLTAFPPRPSTRSFDHSLGLSNIDGIPPSTVFAT